MHVQLASSDQYAITPNCHVSTKFKGHPVPSSKVILIRPLTLLFTMAAWKCQLCSASYVNLPELVSHFRASHSQDEGLKFVCQVSQCPKIFRNANTWYRHVVKKHSTEYFTSIVASSSDSESEIESEEEEQHNNDDDDIDTSADFLSAGLEDSSMVVLPPEVPIFISKEEVAGKLLKLKEKYIIPHAAIYEVVELVQMVCDKTAADALSAIVMLGETCGHDTTSAFFQQLPGILDGLNSPLATIGTIYKQHSYIAQNLPYVVCYIPLAHDHRSKSLLLRNLFGVSLGRT